VPRSLDHCEALARHGEQVRRRRDLSEELTLRGGRSPGLRTEVRSRARSQVSRPERTPSRCHLQTAFHKLEVARRTLLAEALSHQAVGGSGHCGRVALDRRGTPRAAREGRSARPGMSSVVEVLVKRHGEYSAKRNPPSMSLRPNMPVSIY
jgi:hypothetical protein